MNKHLRLVVDNTKNKIEPLRENTPPIREDDIPLLGYECTDIREVKEQVKEDVKDAVSGAAGWLAVGACVAVWDYSRRTETMTSAFRRGRESENKYVRAATIGGLAVTGAHLMGWLPNRVDPFNWLARLR